MLTKIYTNALKVIATKPFKLWGISLIAVFLSFFISIAFGLVFGIAFCLTMLLSVGTVMVYLHGYRGEKVEGKYLFDAFKDGKTAGRTIKGMGWSQLLIALWGLIPIVGPIIAIIRMYQYRLVPYILVQESDGDPFDAYKVSTERTKGYVGTMFAADIIPYAAVGVAALILSLLGKIPYIGVLFNIILFIFLVVVFICLPLFLGLVQAAFYEEIMNNLKEKEAAPVIEEAKAEEPVAPAE
ncbi:MAG: hypothetical protein II719_02435 [Clostridia bacterium]|nr:hypothetical protein [Clostridia bacterium]